jgi:hypothetical protein
MSYKSLGNPLGSYYEFTPHQVFDGVGEYYETAPTSGLGSYYEFSPHQVFGAFGAETTFNAQQVWADARLGGSCFTPGNPNFENESMLGTCNAAGGRATREIQAALNALGYSTPLDGRFAGATKANWNKFMAQHKLSSAIGEVQEQGLLLIEEQLRKGDTPGPDTPLKTKKVNGKFIPVNGDSKAGLGALGVVALIGLAAFGAAMVIKKRRGGAKSSRSMVRLKP